MKIYKEIYQISNARFFDGSLPEVRFKEINKKKADFFGDYWPTKNLVRINWGVINNHEDLLGTILHEMIHIWQVQIGDTNPWHGKTFKKKAKWIEKTTKFKIR